MEITEERPGDVLQVRIEGNVRSDYDYAEARIRLAAQSGARKVLLVIRYRYATNSAAIGWLVKQEAILLRSGAQVAVALEPSAYQRLPETLRTGLHLFSSADDALEFLAASHGEA